MKGRIFPKLTKRHAKTPLFSGFFAVLVPRETDTENQTVTRETYNFDTHHSPVNFAFALEFYSLIITVYVLKTYVKSAFSFRFNTQIIVCKHRKLHNNRFTPRLQYLYCYLSHRNTAYPKSLTTSKRAICQPY